MCLGMVNAASPAPPAGGGRNGITYVQEVEGEPRRCSRSPRLGDDVNDWILDTLAPLVSPFPSS